MTLPRPLSLQRLEKDLKEALSGNQEVIRRLWQDQEPRWLEGGCFCLAAALTLCMPDAESWGVFEEKEDIFHHALVLVTLDGHDWLIDGAGAHRPEECLAAWRQQECRDDLSLEPLPRDRLWGAAMADEVVDIDKLAEYLQQAVARPEHYMRTQAPRDTGSLEPQA